MAAGDFRWNDHNIEHAERHGCRVSEIESVVRRAGHGFPRYVGNGKWAVIGRGMGHRVVEVIFIYDDDDTVYVIHAQPESTRRRRRK
jgi:uncharacterized DUF497 family protein